MFILSIKHIEHKGIAPIYCRDLLWGLRGRLKQDGANSDGNGLRIMGVRLSHWRVSSRPFCPSTHVLTPPYNGAPREVARDNIYDYINDWFLFLCSRWVAYSRKHREHPFSWDFLYKLLCRLDDVWEADTLSRDEVREYVSALFQ